MKLPRRDLKGGKSLWLKDRPLGLEVRIKPRRTVYDVAIIGAGVSGALAAANLIGSGKSVVVFDRRGPASGSTSASTALIQWEIDETLSSLGEKLGRKTAAAIYKSSLNGLLSLRRMVLNHRIDCDWADRTSLTVTGNAIGHRALHDEWKLRKLLGFPSYFMEGKDLVAGYGIDRTAAIVSGMNAELHPVKLTRALLARAIADGIELVAPISVTEISASYSASMVAMR